MEHVAFYNLPKIIVLQSFKFDYYVKDIDITLPTLTNYFYPL